MGRFVNSGNSAFQVALNSEIYVDKTGLLAYTNKVMDTTAKFICNSRPRRFGKSITADMLTAYYCKNCNSEEMFSSLEISQIPDFRKYLNQYDVIHLDIQWCMEPAGGPENVGGLHRIGHHRNRHAGGDHDHRRRRLRAREGAHAYCRSGRCFLCFCADGWPCRCGAGAGL